ncbi:hypothetical protein HAPAU_39380 [Halalkalicoccus paucihalophilus]|uniref:Uncharacterized protein n=1 Tax=Halalkalicoccus paucihalophilus TaxID=1008153 RepID=A0A151A8B7_9EURY|nr:hypothetical protein [Halalkalicoccus paucihalophilus]KYH23859.1 hypothetical protein HAPAU_39380 [Halalkalicoccus paucihalophilus]
MTVERVEEGQQFTGLDDELTEGVWMETFFGFQNVFEEHDLLVVLTVLTVPFSNDVLGSTEVDSVGTYPVYDGPITAACNLMACPLPRSRRVDGQRTAGQVADRRSAVRYGVGDPASAAYERANPWYDDYPGL